MFTFRYRYRLPSPGTRPRPVGIKKPLVSLNANRLGPKRFCTCRSIRRSRLGLRLKRRKRNLELICLLLCPEAASGERWRDSICCTLRAPSLVEGSEDGPYFICQKAGLSGSCCAASSFTGHEPDPAVLARSPPYWGA